MEFNIHFQAHTKREVVRMLLDLADTVKTVHCPLPASVYTIRDEHQNDIGTITVK